VEFAGEEPPAPSCPQDAPENVFPVPDVPNLDHGAARDDLDVLLPEQPPTLTPRAARALLRLIRAVHGRESRRAG
jgi:hypothetical protein